MSKIIPLPIFQNKSEKPKMTKKRKTKATSSTAPPAAEMLEDAEPRSFNRVLEIGIIDFISGLI